VPDPQETRLAVDFVALSLELGDAADALAQAERLLADAGTPAPFHERLQFLRGRALEVVGRVEDAVEVHEELLATYPAGEFALASGIALSRCCRELGDLGRAIGIGEALLASAAERGLAADDEAIELTVTVAAAYHYRGDTAYAVRLCRKAASMAEKSGSPRSRAAAYWNASILELESGAVSGAVAMAAKALALLGLGGDGRNLARLRSELGIMQLQLDPPEVEEALTNLAAAAELMAQSSAGWIDKLRNDAALARATLMSGDVALAMSMADDVYERAKSDALLVAADALSLQGQAAIHQGDATTAAGYFKQAVFVMTGVGADRDAANLWFELGGLLESLGEHDAARQAFRSAAAASGLRARPRVTVGVRH
jgi:tetratricopeptide (TPR) repeat protein